MTDRTAISRREFVADVGSLAAAVPLAGSAALAALPTAAPSLRHAPAGDRDLSWIDRLRSATDRAVFDWPSLGTPDDSIVLQIATRYLDNCAAAYPAGAYKAIAVMNIRTTAIPAALTDSAWSRYALGAEYKLVDSATKADATRNVFWSAAASTAPNSDATASAPRLLADIVQRDGILLVCDFAMGHLAARLAAKANESADDVHQTLRHSLVPGAYAVPSGIFGLARSQNAGCAFVRM
jgi:hypothetical protein